MVQKNASEEKLQKIAIGTAITGKTSESALTPCLTLFCRPKAGANIEGLNDSLIVSNTVMLHYKSAEEQVGLFKAMHFDKICHFQA